VGGDDVFTEKKYLLISTIQKRYRKGCLVSARYRFWPLAEYTWDLERGTHLKVPEIISLKNDFWDLNLGRFLRFVDFPIPPQPVNSASSASAAAPRSSVSRHPLLRKPGDDNWFELIIGAFGRDSRKYARSHPLPPMLW
jgi:hypothetical protein